MNANGLKLRGAEHLKPLLKSSSSTEDTLTIMDAPTAPVIRT